MAQILLKDYSSHIKLKEEFKPSQTINNKNEVIVTDLIELLLNEPGAPKNIEIPHDYINKRNLLRALFNNRGPTSLNNDILEKISTLLQIELKDKGIVDVGQLESVSAMFPNTPFSQADKFLLWQGDITQINADAIVNAANKQMLGCFQPLHACIDNAIHSSAGPQLREDCNIIITLQGELEKTGDAKITRAYNLPSQFVLHTVGPIVTKGTTLTQRQKDELASCYISCLELANEVDCITSITFCAISTGVFGFPKREAAHIAVNTVNDWLESHPNGFTKIIFNVFSDSDWKDYINVFKPL